MGNNNTQEMTSSYNKVGIEKEKNDYNNNLNSNYEQNKKKENIENINKDINVSENNKREISYKNTYENINDNTTVTSLKKNIYKKITEIPKKEDLKNEIKQKCFLICKMTKKKSGRKKKNICFINNKSKHLKDRCDNMSRKIKSWIISDLIKFINKKFNKYENYRRGIKMRLYTIKKQKSYNIKIDYNKDLLEKKVKDILSEEVSNKIINQKNILNNNIKLINKTIEENKYNDIINILNLRFLDCINHYMGKEEIDCLKGFEKGYQEKKYLIKDYIERFEYFVKNIEKYYSDKEFRINLNNKKNIKYKYFFCFH